jgi:hypothetical protein
MPYHVAGARKKSLLKEQNDASVRVEIRIFIPPSIFALIGNFLSFWVPSSNKDTVILVLSGDRSIWTYPRMYNI